MNLAAVGNHLWQSTVFAALAWLLVRVLRKNRARVRYSVWMLASLKFLFPLSLLIALGGHISWPAQRYVAVVNGPVVDFIGLPFGPAATASGTALSAAKTAPGRSPGQLAVEVALAIWLAGVVAVVTLWLVRMRRVSKILSTARRLENGLEIESLERVKTLRRFDRQILCATTQSVIEPGVHGIFRPVLMLPPGLIERLEASELDAIVDHELCHVRWYDNLAATIHMAVEAIYWFHPIVWWMGTRLIDERERACDEQVIENGGDSKVYAGAILKVCEFYVASPLECVAGVSGGNLRKRIEEIMSHRIAQKLSGGRKLLLAGAGVLALAAPVVVGMLNAPKARAQSSTQVSRPSVQAPAALPLESQVVAPQGAPQPAVRAAPVAPATATAALKFEVASIRPHPDPPHSIGITIAGNRLVVEASFVGAMVAFAYDLKNYQLEMPKLEIAGEMYDIQAKAEGDGTPTRGDFQKMLQALLADRFHLEFHREMREMAVYALVVGKNGPKFPESAADATYSGRFGVNGRNQNMTLSKATMDLFVRDLPIYADRPIVDRTGLTGAYDIKFEATPWFRINANPDAATDISVFTAVQEQLGLKLEPQKAMIEVVVVDHFERPTEN